MKLSITSKVTILVSLFLIFLSINLTYRFIAITRKVLLRELDERINSLLGGVSNLIGFNVLVKDRDSILSIGEEILSQKDVVYCKITSSEGEILFEKGEKEKIDREYKSPIIVERITDNSEATLLGIAEKQKKVIGELYLGISLLNFKEKFFQMIKLTGLSTFIFLVFTLITMIIFFNLILHRPIYRLTAGIRKIAQGDLNYKVKINSKDELGELAFAFNKMTEDLSKIIVSKDYVDNIIETMTDALIVTDEEGKIKNVNNETLKLLGYNSKEDLIGKLITIAFWDEKEVMMNLEKVIENKSCVGFETKYKTKSGEMIPVNCFISVMNHKKNTIDGIIFLAHDLREIKRLQTRLIQSEKLSAVGQLAGGVAHEINNPLGVILGFAQLIAKDVKEGDPLYVPLKSIEREAIRCKKLVGDLLTFSRVSKTEKETVGINDVISQTISLVESRAKTANVKIIQALGANLPSVVINKNRIQQVIVNLCNNAIDAIVEKGVDVGEIKITTGLVKEGDKEYIEILVADTGIGMSEEVKRHIFEPFFTTKDVGKGTGLGLSLVYETIQQHDGVIEVESELGKGTTFKIKLPLKQTV